MARGEYVWLIQPQVGRAVGAWTVKHELLSWLERRQAGPDPVDNDAEVWRLREGRTDGAVLLGTAGSFVQVVMA